MNRGNIKIKETAHQKFVVEVKLADGNLWLTKHEVADLFNVSIGKVNGYLNSLFKSGILQEENVTRIHLFDRNGKPSETILYNLEVLMSISYRIASFEARAFRKWIMDALCEYTGDGKNIREGEVLVVCHIGRNLSSVVALN